MAGPVPGPPQAILDVINVVAGICWLVLVAEYATQGYVLVCYAAREAQPILAGQH